MQKKIKLLFLVCSYIHTCTNLCILCQNMFEWLGFSFSHCIYNKICLMRNEGHFLKMENISALMELNLTLSIVSGSSNNYHWVCQQISPSCLIFSCSISWVVWVPFSMNIFPIHQPDPLFLWCCIIIQRQWWYNTIQQFWCRVPSGILPTTFKSHGMFILGVGRSSYVQCLVYLWGGNLYYSSKTNITL